MKCPKCETESLVSARIHGIEVDRCPRCQGIWFDEEELTTLLDEDPKDLKRLSPGTAGTAWNTKPGHCPRDGSKLLRAYSARNRETIIDTCPECKGIWLDGGEVNRLI